MPADPEAPEAVVLAIFGAQQPALPAAAVSPVRSKGSIAPLDTSTKINRPLLSVPGTSATVAWPIEPPEVLCVGLSTIDQLWAVERFPPSGSRTLAFNQATSGGGPAATAAVAAARLGARVALWSNLGDDGPGDEATAELESFGVDLGGVRRIRNGRTAVSAVLVNPQGERYIFPFFGDALKDATLEEFPADQLASAACVLVDLRLPGLTNAVLERARELGIPSVGDVSNTRNWELTGGLDHLIASQECAAEVLGRDDPMAALEALKQRQEQVVGVTLGDDGVLLDAGDGPRHLPAFRVDSVDTTGAGDVFHGAYAYGVAGGWPPRAAAGVAAAAAALACTGVGRGAIPTAAAVRDLLRANGW